MDSAQMERSIQRMAHEIIEQNRGLEKIRLVGIRSRGVPIAERLSDYLKLISNQEVPVGFWISPCIGMIYPPSRISR